ncbi:CHRNA7-FAM7A fusion protein-like [Garra rufa]|uniref:CHRNA7-FAM7A fusion protein-like n=1 Tax=Garra rufa TaxID=137080 RepID=UPI003CCED02F
MDLFVALKLQGYALPNCYTAVRSLDASRVFALCHDGFPHGSLGMVLADERFDATFHTNVLVNSSGYCQYLPPGIFKSTCYIDVRWFPFDVQRCDLKFGSWTYGGWSLDLQMMEADITGYIANGEWDLVEVPGRRNEKFYDCCKEPYPDVTFTVVMRRRTLYYGLNLLIPCVLISTLALLVFLLPADSGEKISLDCICTKRTLTGLLSEIKCFCILGISNVSEKQDLPLTESHQRHLVEMITQCSANTHSHSSSVSTINLSTRNS